jgi:hypothetical protein
MSFDPATFLNQTFDESNSTESVPTPEGEYLAIAEKVEVKQWSSRDGSTSGLKAEILWDIQDDAVKALLDKTSVKSRQQIMLDLTETGNLDFGKGKNVQLGRLRTAVDLNNPGEAFAFGMIQGRMATVSVKHRVVEDRIYDEVKGVAKAG